jgi:hypothetical protein
MPVRAQVVNAEPAIENFEDDYHDAANRLERAVGRFAGSTTLPVPQGLCAPPRPWNCETRPGSRCPTGAAAQPHRRCPGCRPALGRPTHQAPPSCLGFAPEPVILHSSCRGT